MEASKVNYRHDLSGQLGLSRKERISAVSDFSKSDAVIKYKSSGYKPVEAYTQLLIFSFAIRRKEMPRLIHAVTPRRRFSRTRR